MENNAMVSLLLAAAYGLTLFSFFAGGVVVAHGIKKKAAIPVLMGVVYSASALAIFGTLAGV